MYINLESPNDKLLPIDTAPVNVDTPSVETPDTLKSPVTTTPLVLVSNEPALTSPVKSPVISPTKLDAVTIPLAFIFPSDPIPTPERVDCA